jgi:phosphatidylserine/phosphatidylglycerophosphate/cardiolipin synthase-like enzyme
MLKSFASATSPSVFETLLTASEGFPALEREFLNAKVEIWASFRIFDLETRLRTQAARDIGERWFDLIVHTLARGVTIHFAITDFDPIVKPKLHRATWRTVRQFTAAAEIADAAGALKIVAAMHPAKTGLLPRVAFWPLILFRQARLSRWLNHQSSEERRLALREMPGISARLDIRHDGRVRPKLWPVPQLYPATHHQKLAVFDRRRLYIGGLDLDERRYDTPNHFRSADQTWHDLQLLITGPAAAEAQQHLESFLDVTAGRSVPDRKRWLLRTLSKPRVRNLVHFGPTPLRNEIAQAHEHYARRTRRLIYLETQYFRDLRLARYFARLGHENPDLSIILILPGAPEEVAFDGRITLDARFGEFLQFRALKILQGAFGNRLFVGAPAQPRADDGRPGNGTDRDKLHGAPIVYIHSKVSIFDDRAAIVSSANLNGRSLRWDTEAGVLLTEVEQVRTLRRKVLAHWLPQGAGAEFYDPVRAVSAWRGLALSNMRRAAEDRRGFMLPYDHKAAEKFATDVLIVPEEMV